MGLLVVGLSHHSAPVEVREKVAFGESVLADADRAAAAGGEAMIVSTCNRVEVYVAGPDGDNAHMKERVVELLAQTGGLARGAIEPYLYTRDGADAVKHLFRVAASLDSMIVGEPQILGQVKAAFDAASTAGAVSPGGPLGRVVTRAFGVAKRVRSETEIAKSSASVASAAVELVRRIFGDLGGKEMLLVGAGKMAGLAARHLKSAGCKRVTIVNRTLARAENMAREIEGEPRPWQDLEPLLARADIVVCSTGAQRPVIGRELAQRAMKARRGRFLCFIDIAVPRDVEPEVGDLDNVYLYDVDALTQLRDENLADRRKEAEHAEKIVDEELGRHHASERSLGVVPTIKALRERFTAVAHAEVERTLGKMGSAGQTHQRDVRALADAIVNKLLHAPLTALKREAESDLLLDATHRLFGLEPALSKAEGIEAAAPHVTDAAAPAQAAGGREPRDK